MKPRLFLDIDGVLNHSVRYDKFDYPRLFPEHCQLLQGILEATACEIVLCTNWRAILGLEAVADHLWKAGITGVVGGTPLCSTRGEGVRQYQANDTGPYVILDDLPEYFAYQPLVQTHNDIGLTAELAQRAIEILTVSSG